MTTSHQHLLSPYTLAGRTLKNRSVLSATVTNYARQNRITDGYKNFLIERAKGGVAMLVTEVIAVDPNAIAQPAVVTGFDQVNDEDFQDLAARVNAEGAQLVGQLWHPGKQQLWGATSSPMGVSDQADAYSWVVPRVMTDADIRGVIQAYVDVACKLATLGFAGVELHGAHGYLINQFLSPWSNLRDDEWGGSIENRTRFALEIAKGIRDRAGAGFIIGLKMPGTEEVEGGIDPGEAERLTKALAAPKLLDYFCYGQGNFSLSLESHVPDIYYKPGHFLDIHARMRKAANGAAVIALGRIGSPDEADAAIRDGKGDLVAMSRALIADPDFIAKTAAGDVAAVRPTTFDNVAWGLVHQGKPLMDHLNPMLGGSHESGWAPQPASASQRVTIVGAGPAGLQAAWVAAARGHTVTLFGRRDGGALALEAKLPGRADMARILEWQTNMATRHGVYYRLGETASADDIRATNPDVILLATGADQRWPEDMAPSNAQNALSARDYVANGYNGPRHRAVLFDQDHTAAAYGVADKLAAEFDELVLMTPRAGFAEGVNYCSAIGVLRRLYKAGVQMSPAAQPTRFENGALTWRNPYSNGDAVVPAVDLFVFATPRSPKLELADALADLNPIRIGDCQSPRPLMGAIHAGQAAALAL